LHRRVRPVERPHARGAHDPRSVRRRPGL